LRGFASSNFSQANCEFVLDSAQDRKYRPVTMREKSRKTLAFSGGNVKIPRRAIFTQMGLKNA
jgi:hypothetical protein